MNYLIKAIILLGLVIFPSIAFGTNWTGTFILGSCCEPKTVDPAAMGISQTEGYVINSMYEGLTKYDSEGKIKPLLAEKWEISSDAKKYIFYIRKNVKFHDSTILKANDVKKSIERHMKLSMGNLGFILKSVENIKILEDYKLEINLKESNFQFWSGLPHIKILSSRAIEKNDSGDLGKEYFRENAVGTGPYKFLRWDKGRQTELVAFEDYWKGWDGRHLNKFIARYGLDYSSRLLLMEKGKLHLIDWAGLSDVRRAATNSNITLNYGNPLQGFYHFMKQDGPLKDINVRKALLHAFPYEAMIDVMQGFAVPLTSPAIGGTTGHCDVFEPKQNIDKAKMFLSKSNFKDGFKLKQAYKYSNEPRRFAAILFQEALAELNIEIELDDIPWGTFIGAQKNFDTAYDMSSHWLNIPIPYSGEMLYRLNHSSLINTGTGNWAWYKNQKFDDLLETAPTLAPNDPKINKLLCDAQKILIDEAIVIPVMISQYIDLTHSSVKGYKYDPYGFPGNLNLYNVYLSN